MTIEEWAKDFKSYVNALDMQRDDYKGIMEYIDDAISMLKEQEAEIRQLRLALDIAKGTCKGINVEGR